MRNEADNESAFTRAAHGRLAAIHAATLRRMPEPLADLVVLVMVATGVNLTIRAVIETARIVEEQRV